jgi:hypothetical protein
MADGTRKPIDQIKVGDQVANAEPGASPGTADQTHTVTAVHITRTDHEFTDVTVAAPPALIDSSAPLTTQGGLHPLSLNALARTATITGTAEHLYWDATTRAWTPADKLHVGDLLQTSGGQEVSILALRTYTGTLTTYNLTVDSLHTYYVMAGATPVLVHNGCFTLPEGYTPNVTEEGLDHSFDRHAGQWFGGQPTRAANMAEWQANIERASGSSQVVPWSSGSTPTYGYLARIDGKWFFAQFDRTSGDLVTAFVPNNGQLGAILRLLGK